MGPAKNTLDKKNISNLRKLIRGIPRRAGSHIAVPKVAHCLSEFVNLCREYHRRRNSFISSSANRSCFSQYPLDTGQLLLDYRNQSNKQNSLRLNRSDFDEQRNEVNSDRRGYMFERMAAEAGSAIDSRIEMLEDLGSRISRHHGPHEACSRQA